MSVDYVNNCLDVRSAGVISKVVIDIDGDNSIGGADDLRSTTCPLNDQLHAIGLRPLCSRLERNAARICTVVEIHIR